MRVVETPPAYDKDDEENSICCTTIMENYDEIFQYNLLEYRKNIPCIIINVVGFVKRLSWQVFFLKKLNNFHLRRTKSAVFIDFHFIFFLPLIDIKQNLVSLNTMQLTEAPCSKLKKSSELKFIL